MDISSPNNVKLMEAVVKAAEDLETAIACGDPILSAARARLRAAVQIFRDHKRPDAPKIKIHNLAVMSYAQGFTLWMYRCDDFMQALAPNYFLPAAGMFQPLDVVFICAPNGVAQRYIKSCSEENVELGVLA